MYSMHLSDYTLWEHALALLALAIMTAGPVLGLLLIVWVVCRWL